MIIVKTKLSKSFDIIETEEDFRNKYFEVIDDILFAKKQKIFHLATKNGDIKRRKTYINMDENDVNYSALTVTVFKDFDTYEKIKTNPVNSEIRQKLLKNKFEISEEIKYFSEII